MLTSPQEQFERNLERSLKERWGSKSPNTLFTPGNQREIERYARERGFVYQERFGVEESSEKTTLKVQDNKKTLPLENIKETNSISLVEKEKSKPISEFVSSTISSEPDDKFSTLTQKVQDNNSTSLVVKTEESGATSKDTIEEDTIDYYSEILKISEMSINISHLISMLNKKELVCLSNLLKGLDKPLDDRTKGVVRKLVRYRESSPTKD